MCSARDDAALPAPGCPIRESAGQRPFSASPRLIAAVHALHRLLMPRHPPCALLILTVIKAEPDAAARDTLYVGSVPSCFQGPWRGGVPRSGAGTVPGAPAAAGLSKLDSMRRTANGPATLSGRRSRRRRDCWSAGGIQRCSLE